MRWETFRTTGEYADLSFRAYVKAQEKMVEAADAWLEVAELHNVGAEVPAIGVVSMIFAALERAMLAYAVHHDEFMANSRQQPEGVPTLESAWRPFQWRRDKLETNGG